MTEIFSEYKIINKITEYKNITLYRAKSKKSGSYYLIKKITPNNYHKTKINDYKVQKILLNNKLNKNTIKPLELKELDGNIAVILEDFIGISLNEFITFYKISIETFLKVAFNLVEIFFSLYEQKIYYEIINPKNIIINKDSLSAKFIHFDFDIEKNKDLEYFSPEKVKSSYLDDKISAIFYSIGIIFYEMLTLNNPFYSKNPQEIFHFHVAKQPKSPHEVNKRIPIIVSEIVMKLLQKDSQLGYKTFFGLKKDLELCLKKLNPENNRIIKFKLGQYDIANKLNISKKFYGRNKEKKLLEKLFYNERANLISIYGELGVGKSKLVKHVKKIIKNEPLIFISSKFEENKNNESYYPFKQIIIQIINKILIKDNNKREKYKKIIYKNFKTSINDLFYFFPDIEFIVGKNKLSTKNKSFRHFNLIFKKILNIFSEDNKIIIHFDNLQWANLESIDLLNELILDPKRINIIFSYRKEYNKNLLIEKTKKIELNGLELDDINLILKDTFLKSKNKIKPLAKILLEKTSGNPYLIKEIIQFLYNEKIIYLSKDQFWKWELKTIKKINLSNGVFELLWRNNNRIPQKSKDLINFMACLGKKNSLKKISYLYNLNDKSILFYLKEPLNLGIVYIHDNLAIFSNKKILESIYSFIPNNIKNEYHYKIFKKLLTLKDEHSTDLLEIVKHSNNCLTNLKNNLVITDIIKLNFKLALKYKNSGAYKSALIYLNIAIKNISREDWINNYKLCYQILFEKIECDYLVSNFNESIESMTFLLKKAASNIDRAKVYEQKLILFTIKNNQDQAIKNAIMALDEIGIKIPIQKVEILEKISVNNKKINLILNNNYKQLQKLEELKDKKQVLVMSILSNMIPPTYLKRPLLMKLVILEIINLSILYGNTEYSAYAYATYSIVLSSEKNKYSEGYELCKVALELNESFNNSLLSPKINFIFAGMISHWNEKISKSIILLKENIQRSLEVGDLLFSGFSINHYLFKLIFSGENLEKVKLEIKKYSSFVTNVKESTILSTFSLIKQFTANLMGETISSISLSDELFSEDEFLNQIKSKQTLSTLSYYSTIKLVILYLNSEYDEAYKIAKEGEKYIYGSLGSILWTEFYFFYSLTILALYKKVNKKKQSQFLEKVEVFKNYFKKYADNCSNNFLHKYLLIEAEIYRVNNEIDKSLILYNSAIKTARENNFLNDQAIANEIMFKLFENNNIDLSFKYLKEAYNCYSIISLVSKLNEIKYKYPKFFQFIELKSENKVNNSKIKMDFESIMSVYQSISQEININKLLDKLMKILIENAGAQRGVLILKNNNKLFVEAERSINYNKTEIFSSLKMNDSNIIPKSIISYVEITKRELILNNISKNIDFHSDEFIIKNNPKSILCLPIIKQSHLIGVLYLENNLTNSVFTNERIQITKLLASQAGIFIENAKLYDELKNHKVNLENIVSERTKELENTQKKLLISAHRAGMAEVATGVLHNIGNILNSLNISTQVIDKTLKNSAIGGLFKANKIIKENINNMESFILNDPKSEKLFDYYLSLEKVLKNEYKQLNSEIKDVSIKSKMIKEVIMSQQSLAKGNFFIENIFLIDLIEEALRINKKLINENKILIKKDFKTYPYTKCEKSKIINVFINLIKNAIEAMKGKSKKVLEIKVNTIKSKIIVEFIDNGKGISKNYLEKIFNHGFTTKKEGNGFGLHMSANSMIEIGGSIKLKSEGKNKGAKFILTFNE